MLQDLIAPQVGRIEERVAALSDATVRLGDDIKDNCAQIKDIWGSLADSREHMKRIDNRMDGLKNEIGAEVKLEIIRQYSRRQEDQQQLPPASIE